MNKIAVKCGKLFGRSDEELQKAGRHEQHCHLCQELKSRDFEKAWNVIQDTHAVKGFN